MSIKLSDIKSPTLRSRVLEILNQSPGNPPPKAPDRIRQDTKPLLNKLESDYCAVLAACHQVKIYKQAFRFRIGNGSWFKPDLAAFIPSLTCWECKGPKEMKNVARGILALKSAAAQYPEVRFVLVWKDSDGHWQTQDVLP